MAYNRRNFLKASGLLASGLAISSFGCQTPGQKDNTAAKNDKKSQTPSGTATGLAAFGLQLYSLNDVLPKDPKGILKQVASFGYKQVESYEGEMGMFWGMSHTDFKKYMDELGMKLISSHCDITKDFEKKAEEAGEIGMKYLICSYIGPQKTADDYKIFADKFNLCGEICKRNGLRFAYHNHAYTFEALNGQVPQDILMQNSNADNVDYQMDIYWVVTAGADPVAWLKKYPNRFRLCHVKDRIKNADPKEEDASCDLGTGYIDFSKVLRLAAANGMQYYIAEQERYDNNTPLKSAEANAGYLKKIVI